MASNKNIKTMDTADGVVVKADGRTLLTKLVFEGKIHLAECDLGMEDLRDAFKTAHGEQAANGALTYHLNEGDADELQLVNDADLALAKKFGTEPLKITSATVDEKSVFEHASQELAKHGLDAPPTELKKLLDVLQFKPRRLVKCGLAPPKALKFTPAGDEEEDVEDIQLVEALSLEDTEADAAKACCNKEKADKSCCNKGHDHKFFYHKEEDTDAALAAKLQAEEYGQADVVLEAVTAQGVRLDGKCLHALLRMLHCRPARFVKLGLVDDVKAARQAYKSGGKACAKEWFRNKGGKGGGKGWGRGMHGRGAGWAFEESWAEESRWGRRGGKGCHGKGRESRGGHGCHGKGRSESRGGRGCHGRSWGPPPPADPRGCGRW